MEIEIFQRVCHLSSSLLQYPDVDWRKSLQDFRRELADISDEKICKPFNQFLQAVEQADEEEWNEKYVLTFDFSKKTNLYLTYVQFGEERERGPALLELKQQYEKAGLMMSDDELPDYLPLMLEFAAAAPIESAKQILGRYIRQIETIRDELIRLENPYSLVLEATLQGMKGVGLEAAAAGGVI
ncbi:nitrate reductase molybdenum cofactor assembly chaperone [Microaerobacter geothermalis]|uniref:nitrate reductase molybdenum cofactor assembly chaperone n=1 Tax=Microaerobacter geothermalis TaxID=674972 RepID=UPI001F1D452F|nr:nitrate reductase molybdenum cofactor assembly chaperone [Microaerobacter geothermalis]MCF6092565.1 nitrate reductase molybdenum cofactor assembly chaperone [Microaerobacter geothermalis]